MNIIIEQFVENKNQFIFSHVIQSVQTIKKK